MIIQQTRHVSLALAVRPDNISTGRPAWPDDGSLRVFSSDGLSRALPKDDGYFIFTDARPVDFRVTSRIYESFSFELQGCNANILRVFLVPLKTAVACFSLPLEPGRCAHIGFYGEKTGYTLSPESVAGSSEITLNKNDYSDLTGLFHVIIHSENTAHPVFICCNLGYGRYRLSDPYPADYPIRGVRLLPLFRIIGNGGTVRIPVPDGCKGLYLLRDGCLQKISREEWG